MWKLRSRPPVLSGHSPPTLTHRMRISRPPGRMSGPSPSRVWFATRGDRLRRGADLGKVDAHVLAVGRRRLVGARGGQAIVALPRAHEADEARGPRGEVGGWG